MTTPNDHPDGFLPPHGGYEQLASYRKTLVVFQATRYFCKRFVSKRDRTYGQTIQALEKAFLESGGLSETMTRARLARRNQSRR